jgi:hypothetical protein
MHGAGRRELITESVWCARQISGTYAVTLLSSRGRAETRVCGCAGTSAPWLRFSGVKSRSGSRRFPLTVDLLPYFLLVEYLSMPALNVAAPVGVFTITPTPPPSTCRRNALSRRTGRTAEQPLNDGTSAPQDFYRSAYFVDNTRLPEAGPFPA